MKLNVSIPDDDVAFLDEFAEWAKSDDSDAWVTTSGDGIAR